MGDNDSADAGAASEITNKARIAIPTNTRFILASLIKVHCARHTILKWETAVKSNRTLPKQATEVK